MKKSFAIMGFAAAAATGEACHSVPALEPKAKVMAHDRDHARNILARKNVAALTRQIQGAVAQGKLEMDRQSPAGHVLLGKDGIAECLQQTPIASARKETLRLGTALGLVGGDQMDCQPPVAISDERAKLYNDYFQSDSAYLTGLSTCLTGVRDQLKTTLHNGQNMGQPVVDFIDGWSKTQFIRTEKEPPKSPTDAQLTENLKVCDDLMVIRDFDGKINGFIEEARHRDPVLEDRVKNMAKDYRIGKTFRVYDLLRAELIERLSPEQRLMCQSLMHPGIDDACFDEMITVQAQPLFGQYLKAKKAFYETFWAVLNETFVGNKLTKEEKNDRDILISQEEAMAHSLLMSDLNIELTKRWLNGQAVHPRVKEILEDRFAVGNNYWVPAGKGREVLATKENIGEFKKAYATFDPKTCQESDQVTSAFRTAQEWQAKVNAELTTQGVSSDCGNKYQAYRTATGFVPFMKANIAAQDALMNCYQASLPSRLEKGYLWGGELKFALNMLNPLHNPRGFEAANRSSYGPVIAPPAQAPAVSLCALGTENHHLGDELIKMTSIDPVAASSSTKLTTLVGCFSNTQVYSAYIDFITTLQEIEGYSPIGSCHTYRSDGRLDSVNRGNYFDWQCLNGRFSVTDSPLFPRLVRAENTYLKAFKACADEKMK